MFKVHTQHPQNDAAYLDSLEEAKRFAQDLLLQIGVSMGASDHIVEVSERNDFGCWETVSACWFEAEDGDDGDEVIMWWNQQ